MRSSWKGREENTGMKNIAEERRADAYDVTSSFSCEEDLRVRVRLRVWWRERDRREIKWRSGDATSID